MKRALLAIVGLILLAASAAAHLPVCNVGAQIYDVNDQPHAGFRIVVVRAVK